MGLYIMTFKHVARLDRANTLVRSPYKNYLNRYDLFTYVFSSTCLQSKGKPEQHQRGDASLAFFSAMVFWKLKMSRQWITFAQLFRCIFAIKLNIYVEDVRILVELTNQVQKSVFKLLDICR